MAFGQLRLGDFFWQMEFREFLNAWMGYLDEKKQQAAIDFEHSRFIASHACFSSAQAKSANKAKNPYTDRKPKGKPLTMGDLSILSAMAKAQKN